MKDIIIVAILAFVCACVIGISAGCTWYTLSTLRAHENIFRNHAQTIQQNFNNIARMRVVPTQEEDQERRRR
jgi:hypothetical protein